MEVRRLRELATTEVLTDLGRATLRIFESENRFDAVRASVTWTSSSGDRWGSVVRRGETYVASLFEKIDHRERVPA